jgi:hypothetical protein
MPEQEDRAGLHRLCDFIRANLDTVIAEWTTRVRSLSPAKELSRPVLVDHLPQILARIADMIETVHTGGQASLADSPKQHALDRLAVGFDLEAVVSEYSLLRQCILMLWERDVGATITVSELRRLEAALDQSITESVVNFARGRQRMLKALDRISEAALGTAKLELFLHELLHATLETTEAVDTAAVMLREGDILRMRAAVGIEEEVDRGFTLKMGEGVAGKIAAEAQPLVLRHAAADPRVLLVGEAPHQDGRGSRLEYQQGYRRGPRRPNLGGEPARPGRHVPVHAAGCKRPLTPYPERNS